MFESAAILRHSPAMTDDPLSEILTFVDARCLVTGGFSAGGRWGMRFPAPRAIKFSAITKGFCWLVMEGLQSPLRLEAGDVIFFRGDRTFSLVSELDVEPVDALVVLSPRGGVSQIGDGGEFGNLGGHVALDERRGDLLLSQLPPLIRISGGSREAAGLQWLLQELCEEGAHGRPGSLLSMTQLAHLMFVRVLRAHLTETDVEAVGWLRGLADPKIAAALSLLHADPQRNWNLTELARTAGMSRSVFAARFKSRVGVPPLSYLTAWRMQLATRALEEGSQPIALIANSLGYTSESAFSNAFKRILGSAPKRFQSNARSSFRGALVPSALSAEISRGRSSVAG